GDAGSAKGVAGEGVSRNNRDQSRVRHIPCVPPLESHPLHSRCRAGDTFSRLWKYMARWYYWRATAETLRTDVSRAKESMSTGGKVTLRPHLIEAGGSSEAWYGGEGGYLFTRQAGTRLAIPARAPTEGASPL